MASFLPGYFWELTENIINREQDVDGASVYDGKVKTLEKIILPALDTKRFIWRGFASFFATLIMLIPFIGLSVLSVFSICRFSSCNFGSIINNPTPLYSFILLFILVIPLLWNYAAKDSVVAGLNVRKAIYILGNYPFRYLRLVFFFILTCVAYNILGILLLTVFNGFFSVFIEPKMAQVIAGILQFIITLPLDIYVIFVQAYLLGTLTPVGEVE